MPSTTTMAHTRAPYGTWKSPITASSIASQGKPIDGIIVDPTGNLPYHIERRPLEGGRSVLVDSVTGEDVVSKGWNVRTGVQEYGGGGATVRNSMVFFSHYHDGRVYAFDRAVGGEPYPVTPGKY